MCTQSEQVEAVAGVFNETDIHADDVPDGAEEGFGAPEFGDEDHVRVRDGQEQMLNSLPSIDPILRELEGFGGEDSEAEDDGVYYGTSSSDVEDDERQGQGQEEGGGSASRGHGMFGIGSGTAAGRRPAPAPGASAGVGASAGGGGGGGGSGGVVFAEGFAAVERAGAAGSDLSHSDYDGDDDGSDDEEE